MDYKDATLGVRQLVGVSLRDQVPRMDVWRVDVKGWGGQR